ncbi:MAG TPA: hypothetical protein VNL18_11630 [Gemmatimonadales bacterium]|nr:hypothetical protein [Gemmatimonadales bacterium]
MMPVAAHRRSALIVAWLTPGAASAVAPFLATAQQRVPTTFELAASLAVGVRESSGVAASRSQRGIIWTHNDSGDGPYLYAITLDGRLVARLAVRGARAVDWEDLALSTCPDSRGDCLYIADTGDNQERRPFVSVYIVREPNLAAPGHRIQTEVAAAGEVRIVYPDGPHDVEALWVAPDGALELVSKGLSGPVIRYRVAREALRSRAARSEVVDTLPIRPERILGRLVTGAAISRDGEHVAIRTYTEIYFFRRSPNGRLEPDGPPCWIGTREPQGEAVDFLDGETLVLTSEAYMGRDGTVHRVRC